MLKIVIVDDESNCLASIEAKLKIIDSTIQLHPCSNPFDAIALIKSTNPDALFLDISMPKMDGFSMLQEFESINFEIIFTTAHNEFAIRAIRMSAFDFLLKPVSFDDLKNCVDRLKEKIQNKISQRQREQQVANLVHMLQQPVLEPKITISNQNGLIFVSLKDIIRVEAESNYTFFHLADGRKEIASRTMKEFEETLHNYHFLRIHKSHIINLNSVVRYIKGEGGTVILSDGSEVDVSPNKKAMLLSKLQGSI